MKKILIAGGLLIAAIAFALLFVHFSRDRLPPDVVELDEELVVRELGDAERMKQALVISPHFTDGGMDGFTLTEVKPGSVADRIGLQPGDIILGVAGIELDRPEAPFMIHDAVKDLRQVDVKMQRGGAVHWFRVHISE
jgi:type II secretory pathway component PulC